MQLFGLHIEQELNTQKDNFHREIRLRELLDLPMIQKNVNVGQMMARGVHVRPKVMANRQEPS